MSQLIKHSQPCDHCGSSDAVSYYAGDSSWCFSCHHLVRPLLSGYVREAQAEEDVVKSFIIPDDIGHNYSPECLAWLRQYDLKVEELIHHRVKWSERNKQLIYIYDTIDGSKIGCIQARNFRSGLSKYTNQGDVSEVMPIYKDNHTPSNKVVIVEDAVSAIKVSRSLCDSLPLLGSYLSLRKMAWIKKLGYTDIKIWLDHDKYGTALQMELRLKMIAPKVSVIRTDLDPKCYSDELIKNRLEERILLTC